MSIKEIIQRLPPMEEGEQVNVHHCKEGKGNDRLYIKRTASGYLYNCFHCGKSGGVRASSLEGADHAPRVKSVRRTGERLSAASLPRDATGEWSEFHPRGRAWLGRYLTSGEVRDNGILYSPSIRRVVLPVHRDGRLVGYQTRRLFDDDPAPKYMSYTSSPADYWYLRDTFGSMGGSCVLVEDMISAAKCSYHIPSAALMGTNLKDSLLARLVSMYDKYLIFLDDDNAQVKASARKIKKRLDIFGECVIIMGVGCDPKDLPHSELERMLT
jgi:hypothetical protein